MGEPGSLEGCTSMGPWGGPGGSKFNFCVKGGIKQIVIVYRGAIDSMIFKGDNGDGVLKESNKIGGNGGTKTDKIDIDWPMEYLTSISGTIGRFYSGGPVLITSLRFYTNRTTYGPFGANSGTSFSIPVDEGSSIVGFHGRYENWLDAIGVYMKPIEECKKQEKGEPLSLEGCISLGPWGGSGGNKWSFSVATGGIKQIMIDYGVAVDSILFKSSDNGNGSQEYSRQFGGRGGSKTHKIDIDWPKEYLTSMSGTYGSVNTSGPVVITSLCFNTNLTKKHGPIGCESGTSFSIPVEGGAIVGFHGRACDLVDAIGVYVKPFGEDCQMDKEVINAKLKVIPRDMGPWGGLGGNAWDDGVFSTAKQILVHVGNDGVIHALQFQYEKLDGKPFLSEKHGGPGGATVYRINLECASEFIASITGFYGPIEGSDGSEAIRSISFHTNKGTYGPFGNEVGKCFSSGIGGKVVGFHGRSSVYLDAISVHIAYF